MLPTWRLSFFERKLRHDSRQGQDVKVKTLDASHMTRGIPKRLTILQSTALDEGEHESNVVER